MGAMNRPPEIAPKSVHTIFPCLPPPCSHTPQIQALYDEESAKRVGLTVQLEDAKRRAVAAEAQV